MKTTRRNTGIYRVTVNGREFRVERMIHEDGHRDPNPWMLVEEYPNTAKAGDYWEHFHTLREAKEAIQNVVAEQEALSDPCHLTDSEKATMERIGKNFDGYAYWIKVTPKTITIGCEEFPNLRSWCFRKGDGFERMATRYALAVMKEEKLKEMAGEEANIVRTKKAIGKIVAEELGDGWTYTADIEHVILVDGEDNYFRVPYTRLTEFISLCERSGDEADFAPFHYWVEGVNYVSLPSGHESEAEMADLTWKKFAEYQDAIGLINDWGDSVSPDIHRFTERVKFDLAWVVLNYPMDTCTEPIR